MNKMSHGDNFDLFFCCLGNGTTVCNKSITEHGDYKKIAHISEHGHIILYVSENYIPQKAMEKIQNVAESDKQKFLCDWNKKDCFQKYLYMMDLPTIGCGYNAVQLVDRDNKHLTMSERVRLMEKVFFDMHM